MGMAEPLAVEPDSSGQLRRRHDRASEQKIREKLIEERTDQSGLSRMNLASYGIEANFRLEDSENARRDKANTFAHADLWHD